MQNGLKKLRARAGLTQTEAASRMGLSKSGYVKIEDGSRRLSDRHIRAAMVAFSATEREVLGTPDTPPAETSSPQARRELTTTELIALARACVMFLEENADWHLALHWLEALIEEVRAHGNDEEIRDVNILRAKVRTIANLARAGLLSRNARNS